MQLSVDRLVPSQIAMPEKQSAFFKKNTFVYWRIRCLANSFWSHDNFVMQSNDRLPFVHIIQFNFESY